MAGKRGAVADSRRPDRRTEMMTLERFRWGVSQRGMLHLRDDAV
jgi:hypothetical protein